MVELKEIGSEFHNMVPEKGIGLIYPVEGNLVFSGRTAIATVLKELPKAKRVLLPSYCCDSMIAPFRNAGKLISFYSVNYKNGLNIDLEISVNTDVIVWCNYFGFKTPMPDLSVFSNHGGVIIEDITHSLFSDIPCHSQSDYLVASLRKWEPINCGGYCASVKNILRHVPYNPPPYEFIHLKTVAMKLKTEYLSDFDSEKKERFLSMFEKSNNWLAKNYSDLSIDLCSQEHLALVDMKKQREIRRNNALFLYKNLKNAHFLFPESDMDCPLFVPILLPNRDKVRAVLTSNKIYCPVHWPRPKGCVSNLYDQELSLICDQRYTEEDMGRIVSVLQSLL